MTHHIGVDLGTTYTSAGVRDATGVRAAQLSGDSQVIPSVVAVKDDGEVLVGEVAERRAAQDPSRVVREFKRRFGDAAPIVIGGEAYGADDLSAMMLRDVLARIKTMEGDDPVHVALSHPAAWGPYRLEVLEAAAQKAGLGADQVSLVPEPVAAAIANRDRVDDGSLVAVYDLGGGTFDAAVVECSGDWSVKGTPEGVERLGGLDFDQAILAHVDASTGGQIFGADRTDPDVRAALDRLRDECRRAKEHLSSDTDTEVSVDLPDLRTSVRLTRAEFEAMVRPRLSDSLAVLDRVVASAGVGWDDISAVLLVGGSSRIPAVGQLVQEHTGRPVVAATNPHFAIALGAAELAARAGGGVEPAPAPTTAPAAVASAPAASSAPAAASSSGGSKLPLLIGAAAVVVAAVVGFLVLGGGGDDDTETADAAAQSEADTGSSDGAAENADDAEAATETTSPASSGAALSATACGSIAGFAPTHVDRGGGVAYALVDGEAQSFSLDGCSIGTPAALGLDGSFTGVEVGTGNPVVFTAADETILYNTGGGQAACDVVGDQVAVTESGSVLIRVGGTVSRYETTGGACQVAQADVYPDVSVDQLSGGTGTNAILIDGADLVAFDSRDERWRISDPTFADTDRLAVCGGVACLFDTDTDTVTLVATDDGSVLGAVSIEALTGAAGVEIVGVASGSTQAWLFGVVDGDLGIWLLEAT